MYSMRAGRRGVEYSGVKVTEERGEKEGLGDYYGLKDFVRTSEGHK